MKIILKSQESKVVWTLRFGNQLDLCDCHGDGTLVLFKTKKAAQSEADSFEKDKPKPVKIRLLRN